VATNQDDNDKTQTHIVLTKGTMVSHYRIFDKIGAGGMGEVYVAEDTELDRKVALKFLSQHLCQDEDCRKRFRREAQAAAQLDHPNIVTIHEVSEHQGRPYFVMQHVEGLSLKEYASDKDLSIEQILEFGVQICEGLNDAHEKGITHRDIKPSNILIDSHSRAKIVDFGLASAVGTDQLTKTGSTLGTIGYMSPEQVQGKEIDHRSDLFSLGVVLYELITKQNPFKRDSEAATLKAVSDDAAEPLARYKRDVPELLESITSKLLEKNTAYRYQSAAGAISDLQRLKQDSGSAMSIKPTSKTSKRSLRIVLPVFVVLLISAVLVLKPWKFDISPSQEVIAAENRLAIMYFDNLNDPADSLRLGEIVTNLLITDLSESRFVQVASSQRLYDILKQLGHEGEKKIDRTIATLVAKKAGARWMLLGNILNTEPELLITAQLIDVASGDALASQRVEGQSGERIFPVIDRLTVEVKGDLSLSPEAALEEDLSVADVSTHSPEAFRLYLDGEDLFHKHYWTDAEKSFAEALKLDSTFTMAHYWLALIGYHRNDPASKAHIANAMKYSDRVGNKEQHYIRSLKARLETDFESAIEELQYIIEHYPDEKNAYVGLGIIMRYNTDDTEGAVDHFKKVIELDPYQREAYNQLAYSYDELGQFEKSIWAINKYIEIAPGEANPYDTKGELYASHGMLDEAIESFKKAIEIKPDYYVSWNSLGHMYLLNSHYEDAEKCYKEALSSPRKTIRLPVAGMSPIGA